MTQMKCSATYLDKWITQNDGVVDDVIEGCLIDSLLIYCKHGLAIAMETYETSWTSSYTISFVRYADNEQSRIDQIDLLNKWYTLANQEEEEV